MDDLRTLKDGTLVVKRAGDLLAAGLGLLVLAPMLVLLAVAIKLDSPGPALFTQVRVGRNGRRFRICKFRTMVVGAEQLLASLQGANEAGGPLFKLTDDPRITRVGRLLRRSSLDELPQLWNVVRGDMSLVGPRPPLPHEVDAYTARERGRLAVRPGITGLWQVSGRSSLPFAEYMRLDLLYVRSWSLVGDLAILARTIPATLSGKGAY